jgi:GTP-binding protein
MKRFIDECSILIRSGHGGPGCVSFRREKYIPKGGPNGGDGGRGGDVLLVADERVKTLYDIKRKHSYIAKSGMPGMGRNRSGEAAENVTVHLPVGTLVIDPGTGHTIIDMDEDGKTFLAAKGGIGGQGNQHFATSTNQAPRFAQPGMEGEECQFHLELKLIADVGLVGFPNAGKSTLLKAMTRANPKIAAYPFTTLDPNLGVAHVGDYASFIVADIPGIIEGAAEGKGLGHEFLRHIERTSLLVLVVDGFTDEPAETERILLAELAAFSANLAAKPMMRVANKIDLPEAAERAAAAAQAGYFAVSGVTGKGVPELLAALVKRLAETKPAKPE